MGCGVGSDREGGRRDVNKSNFIAVYARVREKTFSPELIKKAFAKTGIQPWDLTVITPEMMAPSKSHSTEVGALLPLPSPIREIRNAIVAITNPNPSTPSPATPEQHPSILPVFAQQGRSAGVTDEFESPPQTPTHFRATAFVQALKKTSAAALVSSDMSQFTSKTPVPPLAFSPLRILGTGVQSAFTDMSSDLVIAPPPETTSQTLIPVPESNSTTSLTQAASSQVPRSPTKSELLARIQYLEEERSACHSQMLIQDLYCTKAQKKLYAKEQKTKSKRDMLLDKGRREYTHPAFMAAVEEERLEKACLETLAQEKAEWKSLEREQRLAADAEAEQRWGEDLLTYKEKGMRRLLKPKPVSRCPTPECFAELKKPKKASKVAQSDDEDEEMADESEVEEE